MIEEKVETEKEVILDFVKENQARLTEVFGNLGLEYFADKALEIIEDLHRYTGHLTSFNYEGKPDLPEFRLGLVDYTSLDKDLYAVQLSEQGRTVLNRLRKARDQKPIF
jgi:hypothetical protein